MNAITSEKQKLKKKKKRNGNGSKDDTETKTGKELWREGWAGEKSACGKE